MPVMNQGVRTLIIVKVVPYDKYDTPDTGTTDMMTLSK